MKLNILTVLFCIVLTSPAFSQGTLSVEITNIKEAKGTIRVALFDNEKSFLKQPLKGRVVQAVADRMTVNFENLPAGTYAISVIHDENENGKLDSNFMGIPNEGFGFGNDAMGMFGPPSFDKATVKYDGKEMTVAVKLKYM